VADAKIETKTSTWKGNEGISLRQPTRALGRPKMSFGLLVHGELEEKKHLVRIAVWYFVTLFWNLTVAQHSAIVLSKKIKNS